jgi:large subunit ribosomal protein L21
VLAVFKDGEMLTESQLGAAKVIATITANDRAKKITVFKFKRKKQYRRTIGHRQHYTELRVNEIVA